MPERCRNTKRLRVPLLRVAALVTILFVLPGFLFGARKMKKAEATPAETSILKRLDYSRIVWPNPPEITRVRYLDYYAGQEIDTKTAKKKSSWMDRLAGTEAQGQAGSGAPRYQLWTPYGLAVDSKGKLYIADARVGAIFIVNPANKNDLELIKNGGAAHFGAVIGLAMDDDDRLFGALAHLVEHDLR